MEWFKWFGGASNDPKFHVVARKTNQPMGFVIAVWAMLLERASEADDRGSIAGFDCEAADVIMGMPDGAACDIVEAMQSKGLIEGDRICKWEERQDSGEKSAKPSSTPRVRRFRERQRNGAENSETPCGMDETHETQRNANETYETHESVSSQLETAETPCGMDETHETGREEIREDKNIKYPPYESLSKYQDARVAQTVPEGGGVGEASLEFLQLREAYDQSGRKEAPLAGFEEYKTLKKSRQWPGLAQVFHALDVLSGNDAQWRAGKAPGLAKFLREQWWRMEPRSRSSPQAPASASSLAEKNMKTVHEVLQAESGGADGCY